MKKSIIIALFILAGANANATGMVRMVHHCEGGTGEYHSSVEVKHFSMSAPRGPVRHWHTARVTSSWLGGERDSGYIRVEVIRAADGGPVNYINKNSGFYLTITGRSGTSPSGGAAKLIANAKFVDVSSKAKSQITNRELSCR